MKIAVVCPTRARPDRAKEMAKSVVATSKADVLFYVDEDDVLSRSLSDSASLRMRVCVGKSLGRGMAINWLCEVFKEYEAYLLASDDVQFVRGGWDEDVAKAMDSFPRRIGLVSVPDGTSKGRYVNWPCVSREWIDAVGWFNPPRLAHYCQDTALQALGLAIDRIAWAWPQVLSHDCAAQEEGGNKYATDLNGFLWFMAEDFGHALLNLRKSMA